MTLPAGLATIASTWDDSPHTRGAIAFCRALSHHPAPATRATAILDQVIDHHAFLAIRNAYSSQDTRAIVFRADGRVEVVG